ncbi:hypothetical protein Y032_0270g852 [Ancylostoma ceylanicum]|uniref:Uncharacterized protein n=1 Tax=Ancylostoma ceylanicum TaxID=53326 RepID=A0A016S9L1_9BILA|nr:hypothetical protein Y032_0270g852 [Ancylostoma ceylanicum]
MIPMKAEKSVQSLKIAGFSGKRILPGLKAIGKCCTLLERANLPLFPRNLAPEKGSLLRARRGAARSLLLRV